MTVEGFFRLRITESQGRSVQDVSIGGFWGPREVGKGALKSEHSLLVEILKKIGVLRIVWLTSILHTVAVLGVLRGLPKLWLHSLGGYRVYVLARSNDFFYLADLDIKPDHDDFV